MRKLLYILFLFSFGDLFSQVVINEVVYENYTGITDQWGRTCDWIELYNKGNETVDLFNWGLSDNPDNPLKWRFPQKEILPREYLVVFASGRDLKDDTLHTSFKLRTMEEPLTLTYPDGTIADRFEEQCVPADRSAARIPDGADNWIIMEAPSPGTSNNHSIEHVLNFVHDTLVISHKSGFYNHPFSMTISNTIPGNTIYYTTNGEEPDGQSIKYELPVFIQDRSDEDNYFSEINTCDNYIKPASKIFKGTVIRAVVYSDGCPASDIQNLTYLVHPEMKEKYNVPVVSIIVEPDDFFSDETGIYVRGDHYNFLKTGNEWERKIHLQIFDTSGQTIIDQDAGARIHGRGTRYSAQKSLRLYADEKYGVDSFSYRFFSDRDLSSYKRLLLRTTRGDWLSTLFTDVLCHELVKNMDIDYMSSLTSIVFINGEYWGIQNLRERQDEEYIWSHHPESGSDLDIVDYVSGQGPVIETGTINSYEELIDLVMNENLPDDQLFSLVDQMVDLNSMIDFYVAEMYFANIDFPMNNNTLWRPAKENGKWRWFFYDCDGCFFRYNYDHMFDYFNEVETFQRYPEWSMLIQKRLFNNTEFRIRFSERFFQVINTDFAPQRVIHKIDSLKTLFQPLMAEHINRWNDPEDINLWLYNTELMKQFAIGRPMEVTEKLLKYFGEPVLVYPNPASDHVNMHSELFTSGEFQIRIFDMTGKEVRRYDLKGGSNELQISFGSAIPDGVYLLYIYTGYYIQSQTITINHE